MSAAQKAKCLETDEAFEKQKESNREKNATENRGVTWSKMQQSRRVGALPEHRVKLFQKGVILTQVNENYYDKDDYESKDDGECPSLIGQEDHDDNSLLESKCEEHQFINRTEYDESRIQKNEKELFETNSINDLDFKHDLALDTGATFTSVRNTETVTNLKKSKNPMPMCTNAGERRLDKVREII